MYMRMTISVLQIRFISLKDKNIMLKYFHIIWMNFFKDRLYFLKKTLYREVSTYQVVSLKSFYKENTAL